MALDANAANARRRWRELEALGIDPRTVFPRPVEQEEAEETGPPARSDVNPLEALDRAIRRKLAGPGGDLPRDLVAAVLDAASEVLIGQDECTVGELNELFGLHWVEPRWSVTFAEPRKGLSDIASNLYLDWDMLEFLDCTVASSSSVVGSSSQGTATMMSDGGIGVYEFTVDDGVYFFVLAESDVCESQWWFAHAVNDLESRAEAIRGAEDSLGNSDDDDEDLDW